jgi:hypothetical protein
MTKSEMAETLDQLTDGLEEALDPDAPARDGLCNCDPSYTPKVRKLSRSHPG